MTPADVNAATESPAGTVTDVQALTFTAFEVFVSAVPFSFTVWRAESALVPWEEVAKAPIFEYAADPSEAVVA